MNKRLVIAAAVCILAFSAACSKQDDVPSAADTAAVEQQEPAAESGTAGTASSMYDASKEVPDEEAGNASSGLREESKPGDRDAASSDRNESSPGKDPAPKKAARDQGKAEDNSGEEYSREKNREEDYGREDYSREDYSWEDNSREDYSRETAEEKVVPGEEKNEPHTETPSSAEYDAGGQEDGGSENEGEVVPLD